MKKQEPRTPDEEMAQVNKLIADYRATLRANEPPPKPTVMQRIRTFFTRK